MRFTIDSNCINTRQKMAAMNTLERWDREGKVTLYRAERSRMEARNYVPAVEKVLSRPNVGEPAILDISFLDTEGTYIAPPGPAFDAVFKLLFPTLNPDRLPPESNHVTDVMLILSHESSGNDAFVTNDKDFLRASEALKERYRIIVLRPEDAVSYCHDLHGWPVD